MIPTVGLISAPSDIEATAQREAATRQVADLTQPSARSIAVGNGGDPFNPSEFSSSTTRLQPTAAAAPITATNSAKARTTREMLVLLAQTVQTTGMMIVRGTPTLVVKNNGRQILTKIGDAIAVAFEGAEHSLVVAAIDRDTYTVEWNGEKVTRPIRNQK